MSVIEQHSHGGPRYLTGRPTRPWDNDRAARDLMYTPSTCVPDVEPYLRQYADRSARARARLPWTALRYGSSRAEVLHFFPAARPKAPLHVFIHGGYWGGYWQELSERESSFAAADLVSYGSAFAALGYGLVPQHRLDDIVAMVRKAVLWLRGHATKLNIDSTRIFLSGSSAGAHLVAMCLLEGWLPGSLRPRELIRGATLLSGIYELEPLGHTYIGEAIRLGVDEASRNSPIRHLRPGLPPLIVARGAVETEAFADQHDDLVRTLDQLGTPLIDLVVPGRNHFDLPLGLGDSRDVLGCAVLAQMGFGAATGSRCG